ncbi:MrcB family domain-containing protein [Streptomyces toxytricini]|uniref:MrcB family domain-containing protein n=1 Tax=Streptomyces toxytricini TaxID=67369 RepID=A0ABW8ECC4_STRT5
MADTYDQKAGTRTHVPGQQVLRDVAKRADLGVPEGLVVAGYGGKGTAAASPWIGVFDKAINTNPKKDLYLAYIFSTDLTSVTLTLQQGVTELSDRIKNKQPFLAHLRRHAARLAAALPPSLTKDWNHRPALGGGVRPEAYAAASVAARRYEIADMPPEEELQRDLRAATNLLQRAAAAESAWRAARDDDDLDVPVLPQQRTSGEEGGESPQPTTMDAPTVSPATVVRPAGFKPRNSSDYIAHIAAHQQVKSRKHEELIKDFAAYISKRDYTPKNQHVHPKDLTLQPSDAERAPAPDGREWLVEAKVVRKGRADTAVREAIGQLREYSYFLYREKQLPAPHLIALFSEDIGVFAPYLEDQGISAIWQTADGWAGTSTAAAWGMVD